MTAPNLLDELEGVVRLAEKATPGPWLYRPKSNSWHKPPPKGTNYSYGECILGMGGDYEDDGNGYDEAFLIAAVEFMTKHHATIADLAKRCEAAERDARRYRWLRDKAWSMPAIAQQELPAVAIFSGSGRRCKDVSGEEMDAAIDATQEGEG